MGITARAAWLHPVLEEVAMPPEATTAGDCDLLQEDILASEFRFCLSIGILKLKVRSNFIVRQMRENSLAPYSGPIPSDEMDEDVDVTANMTRD
jgi:hypothetical protein